MQYTIVTGMSGSGKTKVIRYLEDMGYFCIDNMPPMLIPKFSEMLTSVNGKFNNVAFVVDTRVGDMINELLAQIDDLKQKGYDCKLLYINADDETLVKRYKESDSWLENTFISEKSFKNLEDIMIKANLIKEYVPYKDLIININNE